MLILVVGNQLLWWKVLTVQWQSAQCWNAHSHTHIHACTLVHVYCNVNCVSVCVFLGRVFAAPLPRHSITVSGKQRCNKAVLKPITIITTAFKALARMAIESFCSCNTKAVQLQLLLLVFTNVYVYLQLLHLVWLLFYFYFIIVRFISFCSIKLYFRALKVLCE